MGRCATDAATFAAGGFDCPRRTIRLRRLSICAPGTCFRARTWKYLKLSRSRCLRFQRTGPSRRSKRSLWLASFPTSRRHRDLSANVSARGGLPGSEDSQGGEEPFMRLAWRRFVPIVKIALPAQAAEFWARSIGSSSPAMSSGLSPFRTMARRAARTGQGGGSAEQDVASRERGVTGEAAGPRRATAALEQKVSLRRVVGGHRPAPRTSRHLRRRIRRTPCVHDAPSSGN